MARYVGYALVWLALNQENLIFGPPHDTWLTTLDWALFAGIPVLHAYLWDLLVVAVLIAGMASPAGRKNRSPEVMNAIKMSAVCLAASAAYATLKGGSGYQMMFQLHAYVMTLLLGLMLISTCRTMAHIKGLGLTILFAALYRCFVLFWYYREVVRFDPDRFPCITDHADSVLFVAGLFILVINALERPSGAAWGALLVSTGIIVTAIVLNNRRIAWLAMGTGLLLAYILLPHNRTKKRINKILIAASPFLLAYIAIGWGNPKGIFKPVGSISSMFGEHQDTSSVMRDIENHNLFKTLKAGMLFGMGWGEEYIEEVVSYDISGIFPQYRYLPHNSMLGAFAFAGALGFAGIWQVYVISVYALARVCTTSQLRIARVAANAAIASMVGAIVQMWGDLGFGHLGTQTMMGVAIGIAGRLPVLAEASDARARERAAQKAAQKAGAGAGAASGTATAAPRDQILGNT